MKKIWLIGVLSLLLNACISNPLKWDPSSHVVQTGETVATLALRYQVRVADLVAWNQLKNPDRIYPGQRLIVKKPADWSAPVKPPSTTSAPSVAVAAPSRWFWPAKGQLVPNRNDAGVGDGINIAGSVGDPVFCASAGKVVYSGSGLTGYGNLLIIKHNERYLSAYGYNQRLLVSEGQQVSAGQRIANMGFGPGRQAMLHFEIRKDGKPIDPLQYLNKNNK